MNVVEDYLYDNFDVCVEEVLYYLDTHHINELSFTSQLINYYYAYIGENTNVSI